MYTIVFDSNDDIESFWKIEDSRPDCAHTQSPHGFEEGHDASSQRNLLGSSSHVLRHHPLDERVVIIFEYTVDA